MKFSRDFLSSIMADFKQVVSQYEELNKVRDTSVVDPYHIDTDPDPYPGCEKIRYGSGSRVNFDTDPDPGKNNTDPDPAKKA